MIQKQTVYLPVNVEDELPELENNDIKDNVFVLKDGYKFVAETIRVNGKLQDEHDYPTYAAHWLKAQEAFVFTSEQLNEYTKNVIKQDLETAAKNAEPDYWRWDCQLCGSNTVDEQSITNTFVSLNETFKQFEV